MNLINAFSTYRKQESIRMFLIQWIKFNQVVLSAGAVQESL